MARIRQPEEILTRFPWTKFVYWLLIGAAGLPVFMLALYFVLNFLWVGFNYSFSLSLDMLTLKSSHVPGHKAIHALAVSLLGDWVTYVFAILFWILAIPGGLIGALAYIYFRKKEGITARAVLEAPAE